MKQTRLGTRADLMADIRRVIYSLWCSVVGVSFQLQYINRYIGEGSISALSLSLPLADPGIEVRGEGGATIIHYDDNN